MRIISKILLSIFFVIFSIVFAISISLRFQLLNPNFWKINFSSSDTYTSLVGVIQNNLGDLVASQGGVKADVKILTDLVTEDNLRTFIDKNIDNSLNFINHKSPDFKVYIPLDRFPKSLMPANIEGTPEEIKIEDLLIEMGITTVSTTQIKNIQMISTIAGLALILSAVALVLIAIGLYKLIKTGQRLTPIAISMLFSGFIIFAASKAMKIISAGLAQDLPTKTTMASILFETITPPILAGIAKVWIIFAEAIIVIGIILFFVKKRYTKSE